ncbi:hypothetical protein B296_00047331 [Ensete ventricosum]|uniref:p-hydroxybenzoic acid efflux pump subunit AaeB n=1 Tax=Ensete ventricosum TaxID=4639 RepID=A0A426Z039_ENSVE|nr:hypothetical protein B296_00047331 [Ensete ventricosum]
MSSNITATLSPPPAPRSTLETRPTDASTAAATVATPFPPDHACSLWRSRVGSALRTALALTMIGVATVYGPASLRSYVKFPAFSYVVAMLIVGEATLGDSLHGTASAFYGTLLGVLPAMLTLLLLPAQGFSIAGTTLMVSLSAFVVALPESTSLITKRIALGQIVIIYVAAFGQSAHSGHAKAILHLAQVAASTALGVVASVIALLFPYPRLASCEIVSGRPQAALKWERPPLSFFPTPSVEPSEQLQEIETPLKGMEMAISSVTAVHFSDHQFKRDMISLRNLINLRLIQDSYMDPCEIVDKTTLPPLPALPHDPNDLPSFFFLFCMFLLHNRSLAPLFVEAGQESKIMPTTDQTENSCKEEPGTRRIKIPWYTSLRRERLVVALKCSLSLGLAVLFGLVYSKENGFWSGLTVAITMTPWREATFRLANVRAQGTAIGSVYGVLGALISQNLMELRFLVLLPWITFASFLQRSRMYGPAGGIAAMFSALVILGRRNYGSPSAFAIARLTETFIGFSCSAFVELLLQPVRASTLAKEQLSQSLKMLNECVESLVPCVGSMAPKEKEKKLRVKVNALRKYVQEAETEPNFWFLPFPVACYKNLCASMTKMVDLLHFLAKSTALLTEYSHGLADVCDDIPDSIVEEQLVHLKKLICSSANCFAEALQVKSLARLEKEWKRKHTPDVETGKVEGLYVYGVMGADGEDCQKVIASFLQQANELMDRLDMSVDESLKNQLVLCLATVGFCMEGLMKETRELETQILELVQRENPGAYINLYAICCKVKEMST